MSRMRGCLWLTAGLLVALLAGFVGFLTLSRATAQRAGQPQAMAQVDVVVAAQAVPLRSVLKAESLQLKKMPVDTVPEGALKEIAQAEGQITTVELFPGEVILSQRLIDPNVVSASGRLALLVAEDQVLMAFPATDLMSTVGVLKPGDHVDILISMTFPAGQAAGQGSGEGGQSTFDLLQNVTVSALVGTETAQQGSQQTAPKALLFTIKPQDALILKYVKDAGGVVDIVLRASGVDKPFETEPVDLDYLINQYRIPTQTGR